MELYFTEDEGSGTTG